MDKSVSKTKELPWSQLGIHRVPKEDEDKIADLICEILTKPDEASASYFSRLGLNKYLVSIFHHGVYQPPTYYIPTNELNKAVLAWHKKKLPSFGESKRQEVNDEPSMDESTAYETAPEEYAGSAIADIPRADGRANSRSRFMEPVIPDNSSAVEELARDDEAGTQSIEFKETTLLDSSETTLLPKSTAVRNLRPLLPKPSRGTDGLSPPIPLTAVGRGTQAGQENRPDHTFLHHGLGTANTISQVPSTWPQPRPTLPQIDALNAVGPKETIPTSTHSIEPTNAPTFMKNQSRAYPFAPAPPIAAKPPTEAEKAKELAQNFSYRPPNSSDHQIPFYQPPGTRAIAPMAANPQAAEPKPPPSSMVHRFRPYPIAPIPQPAAPKNSLPQRTKRKTPMPNLWSHPRHLHPTTIPPPKAKKACNTWYGPPLTSAQRHPSFFQQTAAAGNPPTEAATAAAANPNDTPDLEIWHPKPKPAHRHPTVLLQPGILNPTNPLLPIFPPSQPPPPTPSCTPTP
ncbi:MAG: hypothetical protein L6R36_009056 [Xanthoria steineri]|nr:MAG: hypothetical protein L6R36_009056 [Xanthoria steineri]